MEDANKISAFTHLSEGLSKLYASGNDADADLRIKCNGREWKVHKILLVTQSEFFKMACQGQFKEAQENKIDLGDEDPGTVEALIRYFYTFDYEATATASGQIEEDKDAPIVLDVKMFTIADKYFVPPLKTLAAKRFEIRAASQWKSTDFAQAVSEVYTSAPGNDLKDTIIKVIARHDIALLKEPRDDTSLLEVMRKTPELGVDISVALVSRVPFVAEDLYLCEACEREFEFRCPDPEESFRCPIGTTTDCGKFHDVEWWDQHRSR